MKPRAGAASHLLAAAAWHLSPRSHARRPSPVARRRWIPRSPEKACAGEGRRWGGPAYANEALN